MAKRGARRRRVPVEYVGERDLQLKALQYQDLTFEDLEFPFKKYIDTRVRYSLANALDDSFYAHLEDPRFISFIKDKILVSFKEDLKREASLIMVKNILRKNKVPNDTISSIEKELAPLIGVSKNSKEARGYVRDVLRNALSEVPDKNRIIRNIDDDIKRKFESRA